MKILKSRTVWSIVAMFIISGFDGIMGFIPAGYLPVINGALSMLAVYFKINPSQEYKK